MVDPALPSQNQLEAHHQSPSTNMQSINTREPNRLSTPANVHSSSIQTNVEPTTYMQGIPRHNHNHTSPLIHQNEYATSNSLTHLDHQTSLPIEINLNTQMHTSLPTFNPHAANSSSRPWIVPSRVDKSKAPMPPSPPQPSRKRARELEEEDIIWKEKRKEAISSNLSLEEAVRVNPYANKLLRQRLEQGNLSEIPFVAMWRSIFFSQTSNYLKSRGKFLTSHANILEHISQDYMEAATLEITMDMLGQKVSHGIPVQDF